MASLTLRQSKGSPLTFAEVDGNFTALNNELAEKALAARTITAGTGLTGGGDLSTNRTLSLNSTTTASLGLADTSVQPARQVATGAGLTGGGDLSTNRTLSIADSGVTTAKIGDSQVTTAKIGDSQVTTAKINALAVTDAKLAAGAVTTAKIGDNQVTAAKLAALARGRVLQVVEGRSNTYYEHASSTTWGETGIEATITPLSSTSKILVAASVHNNISATSGTITAGGYRILRGGTTIYYSQGGSPTVGVYEYYLNMPSTSTAYQSVRFAINILDNPATTSATTYKVQVQPHTNNIKMEGPYTASGPPAAEGLSFIVLMEVAV